MIGLIIIIACALVLTGLVFLDMYKMSRDDVKAMLDDVKTNLDISNTQQFNDLKNAVDTLNIKFILEQKGWEIHATQDRDLDHTGTAVVSDHNRTWIVELSGDRLISYNKIDMFVNVKAEIKVQGKLAYKEMKWIDKNAQTLYTIGMEEIDR